MGRPKGSGKKKLIPLSEESKKLVEKGLQDAKEGKIEKIALEKELTPLTKEQLARREKLKGVMRDINKEGIKSGMKIDFANTIPPFEKQDFGYKCITDLTNGGIKRGQYSTIWGDPDCGKTTIAYKMIASAQKSGRLVTYINMEKGYDPIYAKKMGVNVDSLTIEDCTLAEQALDTVIKLCTEEVVDLIVIDSVHGLSPKEEQLEGKGEATRSVEDNSRALLARKLSQFFRMSIPHVAKAKCAVLLIGQTRTFMGHNYSLESLSGGRAIKHYSRLILHITRGSKADAPSEQVETGKLTDKGKKAKEIKILGWDCHIKVDKSQSDGCKYLDEIHVPFIAGEGIKED